MHECVKWKYKPDNKKNNYLGQMIYILMGCSIWFDLYWDCPFFKSKDDSEYI